MVVFESWSNTPVRRIVEAMSFRTIMSPVEGAAANSSDHTQPIPAMTAMHMAAVARMSASHAKPHAFGPSGTRTTASKRPMAEYTETGCIHVQPVKPALPS